MATLAPLLGEPLPVELMNTISADRNGIHDALESPGGVSGWLGVIWARTEVRMHEIPQDEVALAAGASTLRLLRDSLRLLAADATEDTRATGAPSVHSTAEAVRQINLAAALAPRWAVIETIDGVRQRVVRSTGTPAEAVISQIAEEAVALLTGPELTGLRACQAPGCVLYFVKQHPRREWCGPSCGNRARVARHYQRHTLQARVASSSPVRSGPGG